MKKLLASLFLISGLAFGSASGDVGTQAIKDNAVTTSEIAVDTIVAADIAADAVGTSEILDATIDTADMAAAMLKWVDVSIASAAMDTLNATPVNLVAAGGAGTIIVVDSVTCFNDFAAAAFELGSGTLDARYQNSSGGLAAQFTNAWTESTADAYFTAVGRDVVMLANQPIVLHASADVTAGDGTLKCRTYYRTITVSDI